MTVVYQPGTEAEAGEIVRAAAGRGERLLCARRGSDEQEGDCEQRQDAGHASEYALMLTGLTAVSARQRLSYGRS